MQGRTFLSAAAVASFGLILSLPGMAQQSPPAPGVPAHAVVTAEAQNGTTVPDITQKDVMVFQNQQRQPVTDWVPAAGDHAALEFFVLIDDSSGTSLGTQLSDIRSFINSQAPTTKVGVAYMQNGVAQIVQNLTSDHAAAAKAVRLPLGVAGANASPYFSLSDLAKKWPRSDARHEVLMVSSGVDRYYGETDFEDPYLASAIDDLQKAGIVVYAIYTPSVGHFGHSYWETYWGQLYLARVADVTGGESYYIGFTGPPVSFQPYLQSVSRDLAHQYLLTFAATPPKKAGLQPIKVKTEVPNVDLVAPHRVYVPAGQ